MTLTLQDIDRQEFTLPRTGRGQSGYPKARLVALIAARSHLIVDAQIGPFAGKGKGETSLAAHLWDRVPSHSLTLMDRNFLDYAELFRFTQVGDERHWLLRLRKNSVIKNVRVLADGDELGEVEIGRHVRRHDRTLPHKMDVRVIHYSFDGKPQRLMTSLLDPVRWPSEEVVAMYHERWEIEIAFDELKTYTLERRECLRSKHPMGVRQEIWGLLIAYNLIRRRMAMAARKLKIQARGMSFVFSLRLIRAFLIATAWQGSPANIPRHLAKLDQELESATLPARRPKRRYNRWVKVKMSGYKRNPGRPEKPPPSMDKALK